MAANVEPTTEKQNIRHAEKRRTATCQFADRLAQVSIDEYRKVVPEKDRPAQTCLATIIAHNMAVGGTLTVVGLGVGTKFLGEKVLRSEASSSEYGRRVRDCHAEVLARRAFRRQLTLEIIEDLKVDPASRRIPDENRFLERQQHETGAMTYRLRPGITLHFYSSSAPCGNATLKKFSKMTKEKFRQELGPDQWPAEPHLPISDSSIHLGQFSLLIKKDSEMASTNGDDRNEDDGHSTKGNGRPALLSDDWTPPGTTIVTMRHKGSIHTCSDKLARWNYLGLQGSLLSSLLDGPLYLSSLAVGRKFTECICRRAICCRMQEGIRKKKRAWTPGHQPTAAQHSGRLSIESYRYNHPAVMGNAVYMDDSGVIETNSDVRGQDVRFHSSKAWCWWPSKGREENSTHFAECLDGARGYLWNDRPDDTIGAISRVSTIRLVDLFLVATEYMQSHGRCANEQENDLRRSPSLFGSLGELILVKRRLAAEYEDVKDALLSNHPIFQQWRRRY